MINFLRDLYFENTLVGIIILALCLFFLMITNKKQGLQISKYLNPLLIIIICLEIYFIRVHINPEVSHIREQLDEKIIPSVSYLQESFENQTSIKLFSSGIEFDDYLENRLKNAKEIRIINIGDYKPNGEEDRRYLNIIKNFIKENKRLDRIISETDNPIVNNWIKQEMKDYKNDRYHIHLNKNIVTNNGIKTIGVIIIDHDEVILGGVHKTTFDHPLFSIKNKKLVDFYEDYFEYLDKNSINFNLAMKENQVFNEKIEIASFH